MSKRFPIIDTDVHQTYPDPKKFQSYLPEYWRGKALLIYKVIAGNYFIHPVRVEWPLSNIETVIEH